MSRLLIRLSTILWVLLLLFGALGLGVVLDLPWWMIAAIGAAGIVVVLPLFGLRWLFKRRDPAWSAGRSFLAHAFGGLLLAVGLASLPIYFLAVWVQNGPNAVPLATMSNGTKTVVFQGMQHVASEDFYKAVVFDLEKALTEGYTLFYEGVQPVAGRPDLDEWFNRAFAGNSKGLSAGYQTLAEQCGLVFQLKYFEPLLADQAFHPSRHVTADVDYLAMRNEFDRLMREDAGFAAAMSAPRPEPGTAPAGDPLSRLLERVGSATRAQKRLIGILCRGLFGLTTSGLLADDNPLKNRIILDFRNRELARFVTGSPANRIYITYGAAHFPGFLAELQKLDPAFRLQSVKGIRPMSLQHDAALPTSVPVVR